MCVAHVPSSRSVVDIACVAYAVCVASVVSRLAWRTWLGPPRLRSVFSALALLRCTCVSYVAYVADVADCVCMDWLVRLSA
jgi:hypothetical protein